MKVWMPHLISLTMEEKLVNSQRPQQIWRHPSNIHELLGLFSLSMQEIFFFLSSLETFVFIGWWADQVAGCVPVHARWSSPSSFPV